MFKKKLKPQFGKLSIILLAVIAVLIFADLLTKFLEEKYGWNAVIIPNFIEIKSGIRNLGCAFSFLESNPAVARPLLLTVTIILALIMIFAFIFLPNRFIILKTSISLIIAGAIGNIVDRIAFGWVRDWFGLNMFGSLAYCNFADFWIVIGAILAVIDLLFLNEWAVFPLTKTAKAVQKAKKEEEERKQKPEVNADALSGENVTFCEGADETDRSETEEKVNEDTDNGN